MRKKRSKIWKISTEELKNILSNSESIGQILLHFGLLNKGGNYKTLYERLSFEQIESPLVKRGRGHNLGATWQRPILPINKILVENSPYKSSSNLRKRLIKEGILKNICDICGIGPQWNSVNLVLQLDHINFLHNDNRVENLRILCPNCHSQTATFTSRNNIK